MFRRARANSTFPPGEERETTFKVHTRAAGVLEARLYPKDAFGADNYAALELPELRSLHVTVYSNQPEALRPALTSDSRVVIAEFRPNAPYMPRPGDENPGLVILHNFRPPAQPPGNVLWIDPPVDNPPVPIHMRVDHPEGLMWTPDQPLTARASRARRANRNHIGFRARSEPHQTGRGRQGAHYAGQRVGGWENRTVVMGFDPFAGAMRYELATPLLLANVLRWVAPGCFPRSRCGNAKRRGRVDACRHRFDAGRLRYRS